MYDDGYGSSNGGCSSPSAEQCWGHRDNILGLWTSDLAGCPSAESQLVMGAAYAKSSKWATSFAETFVAACGPKPTGEVFTWAEAQAAIVIRRPRQVGIASSADGKGYFIVSSTGKVFVTGDAHSHGGIAARSLRAPIVAIAVDGAKGGYWLVGSNGEVYPFGSAPFYGDLRADHLVHPVVCIAADKRSGVYWLVTSNGPTTAVRAPGSCRARSSRSSPIQSRPGTGWSEVTAASIGSAASRAGAARQESTFPARSSPRRRPTTASATGWPGVTARCTTSATRPMRAATQASTCLRL
jgi:hypothetical protein